MAASHFSHTTLRYITSVQFRIAPMSPSKATQSLRLLLSSMPFKPPKGQQTVPLTSLTTVAEEAEQGIDVTYSDKQTQKFKADDTNVSDLIRKVSE